MSGPKKPLFSFSLIGIWFALLFSYQHITAQNVFDSLHSIQFAHFLTSTKQFDLAKKEWAYINRLYPQHIPFQLKYLSNYEQKGEFEHALLIIQRWYPDIQQLPPLLAEAKLKNLYFLRAIDESLQFIDDAPQFDAFKKNEYSGLLYLYNQQPHKAKDFIISANQQTQMPTYEPFQLYEAAMQLDVRSPTKAALMSAIVPGTGKIYAKHWKDGILSMIFVGAATFQAYRGFNNRGITSIHAWIFTTVGTGYYLGNIYGSYHAAKKYNDKIYHPIHDRIDAIMWAE
jgi:hypothetical protein